MTRSTSTRSLRTQTASSFPSLKLIRRRAKTLKAEICITCMLSCVTVGLSTAATTSATSRKTPCRSTATPLMTELGSNTTTKTCPAYSNIWPLQLGKVATTRATPTSGRWTARATVTLVRSLSPPRTNLISSRMESKHQPLPHLATRATIEAQKLKLRRRKACSLTYWRRDIHGTLRHTCSCTLERIKGQRYCRHRTQMQCHEYLQTR